MTGALRVGLVGTGPWARLAHGPGLRAARGVELAGVWGRDPVKAGVLAAGLEAATYPSYDDLLADVDAVAFAVPPAVQADLALVAARAGRHLLLDKPVAMDVAAARAVRDAAAEAGVRSVVFFTDRFFATSRAWFDVVAGPGSRGGWLRWFSALQEAGNPFGASAWRQEHGALWDIGPHALSTLSGALGPVVAISAVGGPGDLVVLTLTHESGVVSTATLSQFAPPPAAGFEAVVWGEDGLLRMPPRPDDEVSEAFATAAEELVAAVASGTPHPVDLRLGVRVVELLADAAAQLGR